MKITKLMALMSAALLVACAEPQSQTTNPTLTISGGQVKGVLTDSTNVMVYKGIPYAAPPVGELRWRKPQPVQPWDTVMIANHWGNAAIQPDHNLGEFYTEEFYWQGDPARSEDCLYLNVWAPAETVGNTNANLPVAMWVHGGAYAAGWGHEITMDGDEWAKRGVILVTINYRLGMLGFLSHPELSAENDNGTSGNYGTYDQVAALKWIKENIAQFGGDSNNITVFGQSAGAASIKNLVTSPLSKGLISKAIIQSIGGIKSLNLLADAQSAEATGKAMMDAGRLDNLEKMRKATPAELEQAAAEYNKNNKGGRGLMYMPHLDGELLTEDFDSAVLNSTMADIPYMIGSTLNDLPGLDEGIGLFGVARDSLSKQPVYVYHFDRQLPGNPSSAYHSSELWYVFHTLKNSRRPFTEADYSLSDQMVDYWTNFAKTGNPNGEAATETWPKYTKSNPFMMIFDVKE